MRIYVSTPLWGENESRARNCVEFADVACEAICNVGHEPLASVHILAAKQAHIDRVRGAWLNAAEFALFFTDLGISQSMRNEMSSCMANCIPFLSTTTDSMLFDVDILSRLVRGDASEQEIRECMPWRIAAGAPC